MRLACTLFGRTSPRYHKYQVLRDTLTALAFSTTDAPGTEFEHAMHRHQRQPLEQEVKQRTHVVLGVFVQRQGPGPCDQIGEPFGAAHVS